MNVVCSYVQHVLHKALALHSSTAVKYITVRKHGSSCIRLLKRHTPHSSAVVKLLATGSESLNMPRNPAIHDSISFSHHAAPRLEVHGCKACSARQQLTRRKKPQTLLHACHDMPWQCHMCYYLPCAPQLAAWLYLGWYACITYGQLARLRPRPPACPLQPACWCCTGPLGSAPALATGSINYASLLRQQAPQPP